jgi:hypothetical protein
MSFDKGKIEKAVSQSREQLAKESSSGLYNSTRRKGALQSERYGETLYQIGDSDFCMARYSACRTVVKRKIYHRPHNDDVRLVPSEICTEG